MITTTCHAYSFYLDLGDGVAGPGAEARADGGQEDDDDYGGDAHAARQYEEGGREQLLCCSRGEVTHVTRQEMKD